MAKLLEDDTPLTRSLAGTGHPQLYGTRTGRRQKQAVTTAADIYGLGTILYEILTGQPLFNAETPLETLRQVVEEQPRRPSQVLPESQIRNECKRKKNKVKFS